MCRNNSFFSNIINDEANSEAAQRFIDEDMDMELSVINQDHVEAFKWYGLDLSKIR